LDFRNHITRSYPLLFEEVYEDDKFDSPETFAKHWGWYGTLVFLASEDITKLNEIPKMPIYYVLNYLTYIKELNKERDRQYNKMLKQNGK
jgi:hypothetical protein